ALPVDRLGPVAGRVRPVPVARHRSSARRPLPGVSAVEHYYVIERGLKTKLQTIYR
ncbi:hypothetical protein ACLOJK_041966, partial [Asimina triloba]